MRWVVIALPAIAAGGFGCLSAGIAAAIVPRVRWRPRCTRSSRNQLDLRGSAYSGLLAAVTPTVRDPQGAI
jgi:hypothetical protein